MQEYITQTPAVTQKRLRDSTLIQARIRLVVITNPDGPFQPDWNSLKNYQVPEWYMDAKFGIFIHWGVYSVPAFQNEWYPRSMYQPGTKVFEHHKATYGDQKEFGYKDFIPMFKAEKFDPDQWAELFKESGAKFVVPVAEHHDGFQMYESKLSKWNAKQMGPQRDVIGELAQAVRQKGMIFGLSSHRAEHWWFMNGGRSFPSDVQDPAYSDFYGPAAEAPTGYTTKHPGHHENPPDEKFLDDWLARCAELVDNYRPQIFWFDWWIGEPSFAPYLRRFASYYYNRASAWGQGVAINYKDDSFPEEAAVFDVERGQLSEIRKRFWQTDTAVAKNSWSHVQEMDYKSTDTLVHDMIDIVSKNGALLLNIGPRADGTIPEEDQKILREIGEWLKMNGEAIYATRPWTTFGEGPTQVESGSFTDTKRTPFTKEDFRFTQKGDELYVSILSESSGEVLVRSLSSTMNLTNKKVTTVSLLGGDDLEWNQSPEGLSFRLPDKLPSRFASVVKVTLA